MQTAIPTIIAFDGDDDGDGDDDDDDDDEGVDEDEDGDAGEEVGEVTIAQVHADGHPNNHCLWWWSW